ncbi:MAG: Fe-S cluster assembly protein SufD [Bacteroidales bacterium]
MAAIDTVNLYQAEFERAAHTAAEPAWFGELRRDALARFTSLGFPTTRQEEWRFTNVAPIAEAPFEVARPALVGPERLAELRFSSAGIDEMVIVNGRFAPELSTIGALPRGTIVAGSLDARHAPLSAGDARLLADHLGRVAVYDPQPFAAMNTAFLREVALVFVPANVVLERPLHVLVVGVNDAQQRRAAAYPRLLVVAGENSQLRLVESYVQVEGAAAPEAAWLTNAVTEIVLKDGAVVDHYRIQREPREAYHVAATSVRLGRSSSFSSHAFTFGGGLVRHDVNAVLADEGGDCTLNGLYLGDGSRLVDNHTFIDHAMPHCTSHELYKGILGGRARAVFNGKILVRPDAQKTDAKQTNKTLLLSDDAQINTKPQLEIYANDVKCTHGATVGQLSADALFYLQARGIGRDEARRMLIRAFASDITGRVRIDAVRNALDGWLLAALEGGK